ncbi:MAG: phosphoribosyltransferase family protein, partial [Pseudomonadota bacterium]
PWQQGRAALIFSKQAKRLVMGLKYAGREDIAVPAAQWMARAGREVLRPDSLLVPVPLHWLRLVRRRYNQAALLAKALSDETGCDTVLDALRRPVRTPKLQDMSPNERFQALSGTIQLKRADRLTGRKVVLIDDVLTTGATLSAATAAVLDAGAARVDILTLARTERYA